MGVLRAPNAQQSVCVVPEMGVLRAPNAQQCVLFQRWGSSAVGEGGSKGVPEEGALLCDSSGPRRDGPGVRTTAAEADQPPEPPTGHTPGPGEAHRHTIPY